MADFSPIYESMLANEGGYRLTNDKTDAGGMTYAGIARNFHPRWQGWQLIDAGQDVPAQMVREFYRKVFWAPVGGETINDPSIARTLFDFAVNAGVDVAVKLAQVVVSVTPDGRVGPKTIAAINEVEPRLFMALYSLAKLARYRDSVQKRPANIKYLMGWINRLLREASA